MKWEAKPENAKYKILQKDLSQYNEELESIEKELKAQASSSIATFEMCKYMRDKSLVFYKGEFLDCSDPETFQIIKWEKESLTAQDKYREYRLTR